MIKAKENQEKKIEDSIVHKIYTIQSEIKEIIKNETNSKLRYDFFNELAVYGVLKTLLKKHRLVIISYDDPSGGFEWQKDGSLYTVKYLKKIDIINVKSDDDVTMRDVVNKVDDRGGLTYNLVDETKTIHFWAVGANTDLAKAKGAAETYATKYMLTKLFMIPVKDKTDPDYYDTSELSKKSDDDKSNISKQAIILNERSQKIYDLFVKVRGNSIEKQKQLTSKLDEIITVSSITTPYNFRERLNVLNDEEYERYWNYLKECEL